MSEFSVQKERVKRGGGASLQVRLPSVYNLSVSFPSLTTLLLPVCISGVDDAESECGLDSGIEFDWIITNEATAPSLEEQLQPILKLAVGAADEQQETNIAAKAAGRFLPVPL